MHLNHLHLSVSDVSAAASFFVRHFDFSLTETRGNAGLAIVKGPGNVILVFMRLKDGISVEDAYPNMFHIGFLVPNESEVAQKHAELLAAGCDVSNLEHMRGALRFYCRAPGGLLLEVGHEPVDGS